MPPMILLSRGPDVIAEDFVYYSPSTGRLGRGQVKETALEMKVQRYLHDP